MPSCAFAWHHKPILQSSEKCEKCPFHGHFCWYFYPDVRVDPAA